MNRVLVVSPHPDDESIGCGGTLRGHVLDGDRVEVVFLTSGEAGGHGAEAAQAGARRRAEAERAARILGLAGVEFWDQPDGALRSTAALAARVRDRVVAFRPDVLYAPHGGEMHRDHRAAARLVPRALAALPRRVRRPEVRLFEVWTPLQRLDLLVDISAHVDRKLRAIRAYESQNEVMRFDEAFLGLSRYRGEMHSWPGGPHAEAFAVLRTNGTRRGREA